MNILRCENVSYKYDARHGIKNVSFDINAGDYLCVVGENGSGKTTLMKCILGIIKPTEGQVHYTGISQSEAGYLPQQPKHHSDFPANVFEIVLSGCNNKLFYSKKDKEKVVNSLKLLEIEKLKRKPYGNLSAGQQQRVLLARALCAAKKLILLDEPVTGLDPEATSRMYELLLMLKKEQGITVIVISHDINASVKYGNKILHMHESPVFFGTTEDYIKTEQYKKIVGEHNHD